VRRMAALLLLLAGCGREAAEPAQAVDGDGARLEAAARATGLVGDESRVAAVGAFDSGSDRVCLLPGGDGARRIGASLDLGEGQRCTARGTASGRPLTVEFGRDCRFVAQLESDRIVFPAVLPAGCEVWCEGRASLAALNAARLSDSAAEAARVQGADGEALCPS
jgi:hypothetical protein